MAGAPSIKCTFLEASWDTPKAPKNKQAKPGSALPRVLSTTGAHGVVRGWALPTQCRDRAARHIPTLRTNQPRLLGAGLGFPCL